MENNGLSAKATPKGVASPTSQFVRQSLRNCLLGTTLRGPRRIVTSEVRLLSHFWTCVCLGSLLLWGIHFYQLVRAYLTYQTYILQTEVQYETAMFPTQFPDIVICPHQMFSSVALQLWANKSVKSPWQQVLEYRKRFDSHADQLLNLSEQELRVILDSFNYPATLGYFLNNLTDDEALRLGRGYDILIDCTVAINGRRQTRHNCPLRLSKIIHRKYLACLQVTVDADVTNSTHEVSLFLDSGPRWDSMGSEFSSHMASFMQDYEQLGRGFTLWLKESGRPFDSLTKRVFLQPGRVSRVTFQERIEHKVQGPYPGTCRASPDYSQLQCNLRSFVHQVQQLCSCNYFEESANWHAEFPHCSELLWNLTASLQQIACVELAERNFTLQQLADCPVACRQHLYNMDVSSSEFDLPSWFLCWLQLPQFVSRNVTEPVHHCLQSASRCPDYATSAVRHIVSGADGPLRITSPDLVDEMLSRCNRSLFVNVPLDQVASVVLYRSSQLPAMLRQQYIVTPALLFSQIGGASSLYLGLSLTFFAEIVDWLARLAMFLWATPGPEDERRASATLDEAEAEAEAEMLQPPAAGSGNED